MAAPTNTFQTYQAIGNREDLIDVVKNISPTDTWCLNSFGTTTATATLHEWTNDSLATPAANAVIEGDDASATAITARTRQNNYTQISRKTYVISDTQLAVESSGGGEEARQKMNKMKELANDIEFAIVTNSAAAAGASGTARQTKGAIGWIATNVTTSSASTLANDTLLTTNLQLIWAAGGKPSNILCGGARKSDISAFTGNTKNVAAEKKVIVNAVDIYQSNFGTLTINLSTIMHANHADKLLIFGDLNLWNVAFLRPINYEKLYRSGGATRYMIEAEYALECLQEKGSGKIDLA
jgi:hypothetical protein